MPGKKKIVAGRRNPFWQYFSFISARANAPSKERAGKTVACSPSQHLLLSIYVKPRMSGGEALERLAQRSIVRARGVGERRSDRFAEWNATARGRPELSFLQMCVYDYIYFLPDGLL